MPSELVALIILGPIGGAFLIWVLCDSYRRYYEPRRGRQRRSEAAKFQQRQRRNAEQAFQGNLWELQQRTSGEPAFQAFITKEGAIHHWASRDGFIPCEGCEGDGIGQAWPDDIGTEPYPCSDCGGTGFVPFVP